VLKEEEEPNLLKFHETREDRWGYYYHGSKSVDNLFGVSVRYLFLSPKRLGEASGLIPSPIRDHIANPYLCLPILIPKYIFKYG
jgi:hypothetical protein